MTDVMTDVMSRVISRLLAGASAIVVSLVPVAAMAQTSPNSISPVQVQERLQAIATELNLTADQRSQLTALLTDTMTQIKTGLTPDQQQVLRQGLSSGQAPRKVLQGLNLSRDQQRALRSTLQSTQQQVSTILTTEQYQQLMQMFRNRRNASQ